MRLLDVAEVKRGTGTWYRGFQQDSLACGVEVSLADACDPYDQGDLIGDATSAPGGYDTLPFGIVANLRRPVNCADKGDEAWLKAALGDLEELALGRALVVQPVAGSDSWIGGSQVKEVPGTPDPTDPEALATLLSDARTLWFKTVVGERPVVHVAPSLAPALVKAGVLKINCGDANDSVCCVWGDRVVLNAGYDAPGGPAMFLSGPITVMLQPVETAGGWQIDTRTNRSLISANELAVVDTDPCQIVRVGGIPEAAFHPVLTVPVVNGLQVTVQLENNPAGQSWQLDWGDGTVAATVADKATASHTYAGSGTYTLLATTSDGLTATRPVTVKAPPPPPATGATAGIPGAFTPPGSKPPATVADLQGGRPNVVTASPATPWTTGQHVQTATAGAAGRATWTGSGWVGGVAP
ncbi:MAG TPA: PKD domain-containing protein [Microlunatus sp.]